MKATGPKRIETLLLEPECGHSCPQQHPIELRSWAQAKSLNASDCLYGQTIGKAAEGTAPYTHLQSRRDCVLQPRVARNELPWERPRENIFNPERVVACAAIASNGGKPEATTLSGLKTWPNRAPRVARSSQPWLWARIPLGFFLAADTNVRAP